MRTINKQIAIQISPATVKLLYTLQNETMVLRIQSGRFTPETELSPEENEDYMETVRAYYYLIEANKMVFSTGGGILCGLADLFEDASNA